MMEGKEARARVVNHFATKDSRGWKVIAEYDSGRLQRVGGYLKTREAARRNIEKRNAALEACDE